MKKFNGNAGEFPPVKVGQFMMVDNGVEPEELLRLDEVFKKCDSLDEQVAALFDNPKVVAKIFLGSLVSRRDDYVTLQGIDSRTKGTRDFPFNKVMAVFGVFDPDKMGTGILSPKYLNSIIAKTWMNVRWPRAE